LYFQCHINCSKCAPLISFLYPRIIAFAKLLRVPVHAASAFAFCPIANSNTVTEYHCCWDINKTRQERLSSDSQTIGWYDSTMGLSS